VRQPWGLLRWLDDYLHAIAARSLAPGDTDPWDSRWSLVPRIVAAALLVAAVLAGVMAVAGIGAIALRQIAG
jgi:hypothetical protein